MTEAKRFPNGCVATPNYLASSAGLAVLASGGNALDAAVGASLTLGVVGPYMCGYGGDIFAIIWDPTDARMHAYNGSGRSASAATLPVARAAIGSDHMPTHGPHSVTIPGAVEGWFTLLDRFGTRSFAELAQTGLRYARDGFEPASWVLRNLHAVATNYTADWGAEWQRIYGNVDGYLRQPDLAKTIQTLCDDGPDAFYRGHIADAIASTLQGFGALISSPDLAAHTGDWVEPLSSTYRGVEIFELPPNTQGSVALEALNIVEEMDLGEPESVHRQHVLLEATKLAMADRDEHITDPAHMRIDPGALATKPWAAKRRADIDLERATSPAAGRAAVGGTIYLCAADASGMLVSLIQSNFAGFGSGVTVPGWGINLQNRGAYFSLDEEHVNAIAPSKRTMHTLAPAMALRDGKPWLVFGSEGGDGQPQTHVQLLNRIIDDGLDIQEAADRPRWAVDPTNWVVSAESRFDDDVLRGLSERGHEIADAGRYANGRSNAIEVRANGYAAETDPRIDGAALGL